MKVVFILIVTAFTICLSRGYPDIDIRSFLRGEKQGNKMLILGQNQEQNITDYSQSMGQTSDMLVKLNTDWIG